MTSANKPKAKFSFLAIGTAWQIESGSPLSAEQQQEIMQYCERFDSFFSRFRDDSIIRRFSKVAGSIEVPAEWMPLITFYDRCTAMTDGAFTACIGDSLSAAGYDADYSLQEGVAKPALNWQTVVRIEGTTMTVAEPVELDFGAAGKGFLVDCLTRLLKTWGIGTATIDASGDIYTWGDLVEKVGLEHPRDTEKVIGVVSIQNQALCASATNRRTWGEGLHHILNPRTGMSTTEVRATWVRADSTMLADGLATALFLVDPRTLQDIGDFDYVRLRTNDTLDYSAGFKGQLYT